MSKKYIIDDIVYYFDNEAFNERLKNTSKSSGKKIGEIEIELAEFLHVSKEAIHNWRFAQQSPANEELAKEISKYFKIANKLFFLKGKDTYKNMNNIHSLNQYQINSIKIIYDKIIEHLDYFRNTDGYNDLWMHFVDGGYAKSSIENKIYEVAESKIAEVFLTFQKERIFLKNTDIYNEIGEYVYNDLYDIYDGKLSYAYRFEAIPSNNPTTEEDYEKSIKTINSIVDKYL